MKCSQGLVCLLVIACGEEQAIPSDYTDPTRAITLDEVTELGFSLAELAFVDQDVSTVLEWKAGHSGFEALPSTGATTAEVRLTYDGGELYVLGDPVRVMEGKFTLTMRTADGALQEEAECLLRATALDAWICDGQVSQMSGSFTLTKHPVGDVRYSIWMSERYGNLMGGVSVTPTGNSVEVLPGGALTGSLTSFSAGVWLEECPACTPGVAADTSQN